MGKGTGTCQRQAMNLHAPMADDRNVADRYKGWSVEDIRHDLDSRRHRFVTLVENYSQDFNISTAIRNNNAFLGQEVVIAGRRKWDTRGAVGTHHYEHINRLPSSEEAIRQHKDDGYRIIAVNDLKGANSIYDYRFAEKSLLLFGQEQIGVSNQALKHADDVVYVPKTGLTRSLNMGTASGITMYEYIRQKELNLLGESYPFSPAPRHNPRYPDIDAIPAEDRPRLINHRWYWEAGLNEIEPPSDDFTVVLDNVGYDFNLATVTRNRNAFSGGEIWVTGRSEAPRQEHISYHPSTRQHLEDLKSQGKRIVAFDLVEGATNLIHYQWQPHSVMVFGEERSGLSKDILALADEVVYIPQYGSTRSINVGISSGIAMYEYRRHHP